MINVNVGDVFELNLAEIFLEQFHEDLKGTPEYGYAPLTYGKVTWVSDSDEDLPGCGQDFYDWEAEPFKRIPSETGWLELKVVEINDDEQWVEGSLIGWYGLPNVRLSFDEFNWYAH